MQVGYEINFNRYFYRFKPPRPLGSLSHLQGCLVVLAWVVRT